MSEQNLTIIPSAEIVPITEAVGLLIASLDSFLYALCDDSVPVSPVQLVTFRQAVAPTDQLEWLYGQQLFPRLFWMNREQDFAVAGVGEADLIESQEMGDNAGGFDRFRDEVAGAAPAARYFGGFRFDSSEGECERWAPFAPFCFVLPLVQLSMEQGAWFLSAHLLLRHDTVVESYEVMELPERRLKRQLTRIDELRDALVAMQSEMPALRGVGAPVLPLLETVSYHPDRLGWREVCSEALEEFASGRMDKIMLARRTTLTFAAPFSPVLFLRDYPGSQNTTYRFFLELEPGHAFVCFTPERLYRRRGRELMTEALAGTCPKESGCDPDASDRLLNSEKDIREHNFVRMMIYDQLLPISEHIEMDEAAEVLQLHRLAHLYTRCVAQLKDDCVDDALILGRLHPTPAVGGVPREAALERIMTLEPFRRGWYAAPVGWIGPDGAEFAVAIRSALVEGAEALLYSGAGLVTGSDADAEWEEISQKIGDFMAITEQKR